VDSTTEAHAVSGPARRTPWYRRVVPAATAVLAALGLAAALFPGVRHQIALSTTRQDASYVGLYFPQPMAASTQTACSRKGSQVHVRFALESHLSGAQDVAYRVRVDPTGPLPARRQAGTTKLRPTETVEVTRTFRIDRRTPYDVQVSLPGRDEQLHLRCRAGRR
jgi:hypothetical protein